MIEALRKATLLLLRRIQWKDTGGLVGVKCDYCNAFIWEGHTQWCELGNLIKELSSAPEASNQELPKTQETGD